MSEPRMGSPVLALLGLLLLADNALPVAPLEVEVSMEAAWPVAPLAAEMLEGLAEVGRGPDFLRALAAEASRAGAADAASGAWRRAASKVAEAQLSGGGGSSYATFLSLRARHAMAATRVEAARGLERADREAYLPAGSDCPLGAPWAVVSAAGAPLTVACGAEKLAALAKQFGRGASGAGGKGEQAALLRSSLDHALYEAGLDGNASLQVVGYVDLGSPAAVAALLRGLFALAEEVSADGRAGWIVVRHGMPGTDSAVQPAALVGYGVELLSRSADEVAKSADDEGGAAGAMAAQQAAQENATGGGLCGEAASAAATSAADPAALFHGIDLDVLARRHPKATPALCKLHGDLRVAVESPPPPWELKRLGANAVVRAVNAAEGSGGGAAGLAALSEAAQDFPSGWARALAGGGDEAVARALMDKAADIQSGALEVNSWRVPSALRSVLSLLHVHEPLFYASEQLIQAGLDARAVVEILRDLRPGDPMPDRIKVDDPRLRGPAGAAAPGSAPVLYDVVSDPASAQMRAFDKQQEQRMAGFYPPGAGTMIRLVQLYGRTWPPEVPRRIWGVGLTLDLCSRQQLQLVGKLAEKVPPAVLWVDLQTSQPEEARAALAFARAALVALAAGPDGPPAARKLLADFAAAADGKTDGGSLCGSGAEKQLRDIWTKLWKKAGKTPPKIAPEADAPKGEKSGGSLPFPSATVNGRMVVGASVLQEGVLDMIFKDETELLVRKLSQQADLSFQDPDETIAAWQYGSSLVTIWHPSLFQETGPAPRPAPIPAEMLRRLPGGPAEAHAAEAKGAAAARPLAVHVLLLGDPLAPQPEDKGDPENSALEDEGPLAGPALFLDAYAQHLAAGGSDGAGVARFLFVAVAESRPAADGALSLAGAMQRCLAAALPRHAGSATGAHAVKASVLASLAAAWRKASEEFRAARERGDVVSSSSAARGVLAGCAEAAEKHGSWAEPARLRRSEGTFTEDDAELYKAQREAARSSGAVPPGAALLLVNGRQHGPIYPVTLGVRLQASHLQLAEQLELAYGSKLSGPSARAFPPLSDRWPSSGTVAALQAATSDKDPLRVPYALAICARIVQEMQALRSGAGEGEMQDGGSQVLIEEDENGLAPVHKAFEEAPPELRIHLKPKDGAPSPLQIFATLDPLGQDAQRLPPVLQLLHEELNAEVGVVLCPRPLVADPLVTYYRMAPAPQAPAGGLAELGLWDGSVPRVRFSVPPRRGLLLSTQLNTPQAWLCSAVDSGGADLDSLRADTGGTVQARYVLEALFVEGWADQGQGHGLRRGRPAAGRQLGLAPLGAAAGKATEGVAGRDSVVVKSGYYQLRAPPGLYRLALQSGVEGEQLLWPRGPVELADLAGRSTLLHARVGLPEGAAEGSRAEVAPAEAGPADAYDGAGGDPKKCKETIHIFTVASGHKYERLLRIMMLSVREHTKCPLRFWLVDNFLSPNFRRILPALGKKVGFAVSSVTYKWPTWLRAQTQKQRVIWAYKILFLDVFFPRQVERVLFIDADQIVRADVKELWDVDLQGNVYGFVPFCGSGPKPSSLFGSWSKEELRNPETVGFRFWEQGFWQKHLGNDRYYHISALFVVDLKLFRTSGAGDTLRDVYQSLTEDPHSLANLDQDLPNYVQRDLPIFSLPPEWLWCESWCSNATKARAKTIDMCQNPVRKEGKLQSARRIAPEWVEYDTRLEAWVQEIAQSAAAA